jgi:hypothetical protein
MRAAFWALKRAVSLGVVVKIVELSPRPPLLNLREGVTVLTIIIGLKFPVSGES